MRSRNCTGSAPLRVISSRDPNALGDTEETVPEPYRSPVRSRAPFIVICASCWSAVQYIELKRGADSGVLLTVSTN